MKMFRICISIDRITNVSNIFSDDSLKLYCRLPNFAGVPVPSLFENLVPLLRYNLE